MFNLFKEPRFSYKLDIRLYPNWYKIYREIHIAMSDKDFDKHFRKKIKEENKIGLWKNSFHFTEYYDSNSFLKTKFQRNLSVQDKSDKSALRTVDNFGDQGRYIFDSDEELKKSNNFKTDYPPLYIGEDVIFKEEDEDFDAEYYFNFPLTKIFNFLFELNTSLDGYGGSCCILEWPEKIKLDLDKNNIKYEGVEGSPFHYSELKWKKGFKERFIKRWGKPKFNFRDNYGCFSNKYVPYYSIRLKLFNCEDNERLPWINMIQ
jgi:hypothetical protein